MPVEAVPSILAAMFAADRAANPETFNIDPDAMAAAAKAGYDRAQAVNRLNDPPPDSPELEFTKLKKEFFAVTQNAKNAEIFLNNKVADEAHWKNNLDDLKKKAKAASDEGNIRAEHSWIHQAAIAERELDRAIEARVTAHKLNRRAVTALRGFNQKRFDDLKELLKVLK